MSKASRNALNLGISFSDLDIVASINNGIDASSAIDIKSENIILISANAYIHFLILLYGWYRVISRFCTAWLKLMVLIIGVIFVYTIALCQLSGSLPLHCA